VGAPLGIDDVETAIGDVTDAAAVERAREGYHAVLHAAWALSFDDRRAEEMRGVNVCGTEIVLDVAHRLGLDPSVLVSSGRLAAPGRPGSGMRRLARGRRRPTSICSTPAPPAAALAVRTDERSSWVRNVDPSCRF
jgi:nucleoside-diphosphate-sugar epimerase